MSDNEVLKQERWDDKLAEELQREKERARAEAEEERRRQEQENNRQNGSM